MIDPQKLSQKNEALMELLSAKHGLRGKTLEARLKKAGRLLPKRLHREGAVIRDAQTKATHPKLAVTVDEARVETAFASLTNHLKGIDTKDRRKGMLLNWLGGQVFNLILVGAVLVVVLYWRGHVG